MPDAVQTPSESPIIAFFDVDNTLMRGASVYHVGRGAFRRRLISMRDILLFAWHDFRFVKVGENQGHLATAKERALQLVAGHTETDLTALAEDIYERDIQRKLWPETVDLTQEHIAKGHEVWLISRRRRSSARSSRSGSASPARSAPRSRRSTASSPASWMGTSCTASTRRRSPKQFARDRGANLADCWAYSDSRNDIPLLSLVGNRVVVNPDATLAKHAREHGWTIIPLRHASIREAQRRVRREAKAVKRKARRA